MTEGTHAAPSYVRRCTWPSRQQVQQLLVLQITDAHTVAIKDLLDVASWRMLWRTEKLFKLDSFLQVLDVASKLADQARVPGAGAAAVQVPYRICPLGAHVDHQASAVCD